MFTDKLIFTPFWGRAHITEIFLEGIKRLQRHHDCQLFGVISEGDIDNEILLKDFNAEFHKVSKGTPLGQKNNEGLAEALKLGFNDLIFLDSDDLLDHRYITQYDGTPQGIEEVYMTNGKRFKRLDFECLTVPGRIIKKEDLIKGSRKTLCRVKKTFCGKFVKGTLGKEKYYPTHMIKDLEDSNYVESIADPKIRLWEPDRFNALGNQTEVEFLRSGVNFKHLRPQPPVVLDIKSETNIWGYDFYPDIEAIESEATGFLSKKEKDMICDLDR